MYDIVFSVRRWIQYYIYVCRAMQSNVALYSIYFIYFTFFLLSLLFDLYFFSHPHTIQLFYNNCVLCVFQSNMTHRNCCSFTTWLYFLLCINIFPAVGYLIFDGNKFILYFLILFYSRYILLVLKRKIQNCTMSCNDDAIWCDTISESPSNLFVCVFFFLRFFAP